jgi:hypothetical protein
MSHFESRNFADQRMAGDREHCYPANPTLYDIMYELSFQAREAEREFMEGAEGKRFRMSPQVCNSCEDFDQTAHYVLFSN